MEKIEDNRQHTKNSDAMLAQKAPNRGFPSCFFYWRKNKRMTSLNIKSQSLWTSVAKCQWTLVIACRCCCLSISVSLCLHESRGGSLEKTNVKPFWSFLLEMLRRMSLLWNCLSLGLYGNDVISYLVYRGIFKNAFARWAFKSFRKLFWLNLASSLRWERTLTKWWHHFQPCHVLNKLLSSLKFRPTEALVADHLSKPLKKAHHPPWMTSFANVTKLPRQQSLGSGKTNVSGSFCCSAGWRWWRWTWITDHLGKSEWKFMRFSPWKLFSWVFPVCSAVAVVVQSRRKDLKVSAIYRRFNRHSWFHIYGSVSTWTNGKPFRTRNDNSELSAQHLTFVGQHKERKSRLLCASVKVLNRIMRVMKKIAYKLKNHPSETALKKSKQIWNGFMKISRSASSNWPSKVHQLCIPSMESK